MALTWLTRCTSQVTQASAQPEAARQFQIVAERVCPPNTGMNDTTPWLLAGLIATFLLAGSVKGATGMGLPTVAMALLGSFMPPAQAASLLLLPSLITNVWQLLAGGALRALLQRLWPMLLAATLATVACAPWLARVDARWASAGLGCALVAYALWSLLGPRWQLPPRTSPWLSVLVGALTGCVTGATGVFVIPAVPYIQAMGLDKDSQVQALGLFFTASTVALAIGLGSQASLSGASWGWSALAVLPALAGMQLGQRLRQRISAERFRQMVLWVLLVLGLDLLRRAV